MEQKKEKLVKLLEDKGFTVRVVEYVTGTDIHVTLSTRREQMSYGGAKKAIAQETEKLSNIISKEFKCTLSHTEEKFTETPKEKKVEFYSHFKIT